MSKDRYFISSALVIFLFFLWAFLHNINPILIPHLKKACRLSDTASSYIDAAVYLAYFTIAIPAGLIMHRYGYKKAIIVGLMFYAAGALLVIPAASLRNYQFFLFAFFIIAAGATFLETAANPYITILGDKDKAAQRLNFAQSFNGVGAFLAPILGGKFILTGIEYSASQLKQLELAGKLNDYLQMEADTVKLPYAIIAAVVIVLLLLFWLTPLSATGDEAVIVGHHTTSADFSLGVLRHRHLRWAVFAQFCYVGAQVGIGSFFIRYARFAANINEKQAAFLLGSVAMVGFMLGRFAGTFLMRYVKPMKLLWIYAAINCVLVLAAIGLSGNAALYSLMTVPFFMSIMYPTIFASGILGLGEETKVASSLLVMAIIGGALAPVLIGFISDYTGSIQKAYSVPLLCFIVVACYGFFQSNSLVEENENQDHQSGQVQQGV